MLNFNALQQVSFSNVIHLVTSEMSLTDKQNALSLCAHGSRIYTHEKELDAYLYCYGEAHLEKINRFLPSLPFSQFIDSGVTIVDWGCGQGLASACTLDWLRQQSQAPKIHSLYLIEASDIARRRAQQILSCYPEITTLQAMPWKTALTSLSANLFTKAIPVIHLFSNILDIEAIDLYALAKLINHLSEAQPTYILSVSPKCYSCSRLSHFMQMLNVADLLYFSDAPLSRRANGWLPTCYGLSYKLSTPHALPRTEPIRVPEPRFDNNDIIDMAAADRVDDVEKFVTHVLSINARDENGFTPLIVASRYNATETVKWLLAHGADVNVQNKKGATALYFAAKYGHIQVLEMLLKAKAHLELCTHSKRMTPYLIAVKRGQKASIQMLVKAGCDTLAHDAQCRTARHLLEMYSADSLTLDDLQG